jgi:hypothetical protein
MGAALDLLIEALAINNFGDGIRKKEGRGA